MEFTRKDMEEILDKLQEINAPYVKGDISTLGGENFPSLHILVSLQSREEWKYGILENGPYAHFFLHTGNGYRSFPNKLHSDNNRIGKFRKCSPKSAQDVIDRINKFIAENR